MNEDLKRAEDALREIARYPYPSPDTMRLIAGGYFGEAGYAAKEKPAPDDLEICYLCRSNCGGGCDRRKEKPAPVEVPPTWEMVDNALRRGDRLMMEGDRLRKERDQALADLAKERQKNEHVEQLADDLSTHLGDTLRRTAIALKGPEAPQTSHDWSDLPERVESLLADLARAKEELAKKNARCEHGYNERIADRCPSCGGQSLFIGSGGWLTCSRLVCKDPGVTSCFEKLNDRIARMKAAAKNIAGDQ